MANADLGDAVDEFSSTWLGRLGIVSVADLYEAEEPAILVLVDGDTEAVRSTVPTTFQGFPVIVRPSGPLVVQA